MAAQSKESTSDAPAEANAAGEHDCGGDESMSTCTKCDETIPTKQTTSAGRVGRICKLCYNASRALTDHYRKRGRKAEWDAMPQDRKKKLIKENKLTGGVKGKERQLQISEEAG